MLLNSLILLAALVFLVLSISKWKWHPFVSLLVTALLLGLGMGLGGEPTVNAVLEGFGKTMKWLAVVVILGAFIGEVYEKTGGAARIAEKVIRLTGTKKLPWALGFTGYLVAIPVFVDVAYIILQPLVENLSQKVKKPMLMLGLALAAGLTVSHTLIPPTPGPLAVGSILGADMGRLLLINGFVGLCAMSGGVLWASFFCKNAWLEKDKILANTKVETEKHAEEKPTFFLMDLLPIFLPILLLVVGTFYSERESIFGQAMGFFSTPMVAVFVGAIVSGIQVKLWDSNSDIGKMVENAILKSALVIMITGAGGSFGQVIKEANVHGDLVEFFASNASLGLLLPFLLAAILTTATGSITVSLIGAASLIAPMADPFGYSPELMAALIGAGSFCVFHANASFFWLLNRLHDAPVNVLYRTYTLQSVCMGIFGLLGVLILLLFGVE